MQIKNIIAKVRYFQINRKAILFTDGKFNKNSVYQEVKYFNSFEEDYLLLDNNQKIINLNDFPNIPDNYFFKLSSSSSGYFILVDEKSLNLETFIHTSEAIYSIKEKKIIFQNGIIGNRIFDDYALDGIGQDNINVFSISKKSKLINFSLTSLGTWLDGAIEKPYQVAEFSGIYENTLVSTLTSGGVLLLDIEKGEEKAFFEDAKIRGGIFQKEPDNPVFIGLKHTSYVEIDVLNGVLLKHFSIQDELKRLEKQSNKQGRWATVGTSIYKNGYIYFYSETDMLCIFDPTTYKIIDFHEFDFDRKQGQQLKGGKENLQVKDGKIYCLDTLGNLYELESEVV